MKQSESQRAAIVKRLLSLNLSTKKELQDIIQLAAITCDAPTVLISLLDDEKQHLHVRMGFEDQDTPLEDAFCRHTIAYDEIMEVPDACLDDRFAGNRLVTEGPRIRFYAGCPLKSQHGEKFGSLCVIDTKPNALNPLQKQTLEILARQVTNVLDLELSLKILKEEVGKVQESEMKLKSIFQSSPTAHILVDKNYSIKAFNKAACDFVLKLHKKEMREGNDLFCFIRPSLHPVFLEKIESAFGGCHEVMKQKMEYGEEQIWWDIKLNPVLDHLDNITGVSIDATDITSEVQDKLSILNQNTALRKIAQIQSHDMRRPVANIIGLAKLMDDKDDENFQQYMQYFKQEVDCLDQQIHQVVTLSNLSTAI